MQDARSIPFLLVKIDDFGALSTDERRETLTCLEELLRAAARPMLLKADDPLAFLGPEGITDGGFRLF